MLARFKHSVKSHIVLMVKIGLSINFSFRLIPGAKWGRPSNIISFYIYAIKFINLNLLNNLYIHGNIFYYNNIVRLQKITSACKFKTHKLLHLLNR